MRDFRFYLVLTLSCAAWGPAHAEISGDVVRVGVLNDISGIFQDTNGMGSVEAARMAAEDFNGEARNIKVKIVYADHQNKADVGSSIARKWLDVDGVDAIVDVPNSAVGLTINSLVRDSRMTFLASSTASSDLTGKACSPMYLFEVKKPDESKYPYDYYRLVSTIPADQAFRPIADGGCSLVK